MSVLKIEIEQKIEDLYLQKEKWQKDFIKYTVIDTKHKENAKKIADAKVIHNNILEWDLIAKQLLPSGIQSDIIGQAINPINDRLLVSSEITQWQAVTIGHDMSIQYGGRDKALCSASQQWRCDAMIAEAISFISDTKFLVLDGFDILDPQQGRGDLIAWMEDLAANGEIDTALLFGTLKSVPASLPPSISSFWVENGFCHE